MARRSLQPGTSSYRFCPGAVFPRSRTCDLRDDVPLGDRCDLLGSEADVTKRGTWHTRLWGQRAARDLASKGDPPAARQATRLAIALLWEPSVWAWHPLCRRLSLPDGGTPAGLRVQTKRTMVVLGRHGTTSETSCVVNRCAAAGEVGSNPVVLLRASSGVSSRRSMAL